MTTVEELVACAHKFVPGAVVEIKGLVSKSAGTTVDRKVKLTPGYYRDSAKEAEAILEEAVKSCADDADAEVMRAMIADYRNMGQPKEGGAIAHVYDSVEGSQLFQHVDGRPGVYLLSLRSELPAVMPDIPPKRGAEKTRIGVSMDLPPFRYIPVIKLENGGFESVSVQ